MSNKFLLALFFISWLQPLQASISEIAYYPQSLVQLKELLERNEVDAEQSHQLKSELQLTLTQVHLQTEGQRDTLHTSCPIERPQESRCLSQRRDISYKQARQYLFGKLHLEQSDSGYVVVDQYCQNMVTEADGVGPGKIPNSSLINCEHTWPQSRFNPRHSIDLQKTDLHHLYPVNSRANSSRGNISFGDVVENQSTTLCSTSSRGLTALGTIAFEPPDQHKGNVARAIFYFSVRYNTSLPPEEEQTLRAWHHADPIDEQEQWRNEQIYDIQGNRNPFIDDDQLVSLIQDF